MTFGARDKAIRGDIAQLVYKVYMIKLANG